MSKIPKKFIAFSLIRQHPKVVVVDSFHPKGYTLSHWKGAPKQEAIYDDTSTGIVLNAIARTPGILDIPIITNNHFDIDGFLGIWSLFNPELALGHDPLLREMALIGDFREFNPDKPEADRALQLVCWINKVEKEKFYAPFGAKQHEAKVCIEKFNYFLPNFTKALSEIQAYKGDWEKEYLLVKKHVALVKHQPYKEIRLLLATAPESLHYYALFQQSRDFDMVLSMYKGNRYELEYKYTTWVDTNRASFPRLNLKPLQQMLNRQERSGLTWVADPITDTGPILRLERERLNKEIRFDHPMNRQVYSSTISPEAFLNTVVEYFQKAYAGIERKKWWTWAEMREVNK